MIIYLVLVYKAMDIEGVSEAIILSTFYDAFTHGESLKIDGDIILLTTRWFSSV